MNTKHQEYKITKSDRSKMNGQNALLIWFTGLSGSGKTTIANHLEELLHRKGLLTYSLDGDNVRNGLCSDLGFSNEDRTENIRRIGELSNLMLDAGLIVTASFISPFTKDRESVKKLVGESNFIEVYISTPLEECEKRDVKGLYRKARNGQIKSFTGINSHYEAPENPDIDLDTTKISIKDACDQILTYISAKS